MKITMIAPKYHNVWEPIGLGYIKAYTDTYSNGYIEWNFFHGNFDSEEEMYNTSIESDIVAFSCTTPTYRKSYELAKRIKKTNPRVCIVFGGWHPTTAKIWADPVIDVVIYGEGEKPFYRLVKSFYQHNKLASICMQHNLEFNVLPWPDREFIKQEKFLDLCESMCGERILSFQSRRGCMMNCTMCGEYCMTKQRVRTRDNDDLLNEIEWAFDKYNATMFKFVDPTWSYPKHVSKEFCKKKIKRNNFPWEGMVHAAFLGQDLMENMAAANCVQMNVGCESGSQNILNRMKKGTTINQIKNAFRIGKDLGIQMRAFFMIGIPYETRSDIELTKQLIRDIEPDVLGVTILCPYPGTDYYKEEFEGLDWEGVDEYHSFWETNNFSNKELVDIQAEINEEFQDILVGHQKKEKEDDNTKQSTS